MHLGGFKNKNFELLVWSVKTTLSPNKVQRAIFLKITKVEVKCLFCCVNVCLTLFRGLGKSTAKGSNRGNDGGREWKTKQDVKQRWQMDITEMSCLAPYGK